MQHPAPLPPLASLWDRVLRAQALPPDLDVRVLYMAIRDRLTHPEWEVRLHALRVLADLLPLSDNSLCFPFDEVIENLGHNSPNVRKAALDALKVFCSYCEEPECAARSILDKCCYQNIKPHSADLDSKANILTGLLLSIPSILGILKRRNATLDLQPIFRLLGAKLFSSLHRDVALRSLIKLRRVCGARDFVMHLQQLDVQIQEKFRILCEMYDDDFYDVYYPKKISSKENKILKANLHNGNKSKPILLSTDSNSEDSIDFMSCDDQSFGKVIIETEIKFDSDTAITMTVLEEERNKHGSDDTLVSEDEMESSDTTALRYSDEDYEDSDVVIKKVRFGGESIKIRTPDSENQTTSEDDYTSKNHAQDNISKVTSNDTPLIVNKMNELKTENLVANKKLNATKRSNIPLPIAKKKVGINKETDFPIQKKRLITQKSRSLSELYEYFRCRNTTATSNRNSKFALTLSDVKIPEKIPSPVAPHREIELLHNLQRSPVVSPRRHRRRHLYLETDGILLNLSTTEDLKPTSPNKTLLRTNYAWEKSGIVSTSIVEQLHNEENWISAVKAADHLHNALLNIENVKKVEDSAISLIQHMWALGEAVPATKAPTEGAVCALFRNASNDCARNMLPLLIMRMMTDPPPAAIPHALLQRMSLHHLVDLIFEQGSTISGDQEKVKNAQLKAALCLSRAAGPAAVLSAIRRRLSGTSKADEFCQQLRALLNTPLNLSRSTQVLRASMLPLPVRRRARSTPSTVAPSAIRRLRPLPDSAPLAGSLPHSSMLQYKDHLKPLVPITSGKSDSSATTAILDDDLKGKDKDLEDAEPQKDVVGEVTEIGFDNEETQENANRSRSPSIRIEDYSHKNSDSSLKANNSSQSIENHPETQNVDESDFRYFNNPSQDNRVTSPENISLIKSNLSSPVRSRTNSQSRIRGSSPFRSQGNSPPKTRSNSPSKSRASTPAPASEPYDEIPSPNYRDVRNALSECIVPARHEDWEIIVNGLLEIQRLAEDDCARAPTTCWRTVVRSTAGHVKSLRSRVARQACSALGSLYEYRGRFLDPELDEAVGTLLDRCADVNRFLRADAASALIRVACGGNSARSVVSLARRGSTHRAGPVRAAAICALTKLVQYHGASRILDLPSEARIVLLKVAGELLADAFPETRENARELCLALSKDSRFKTMLKEAMTPTRYRTVEKYIEKLRSR